MRRRWGRVPRPTHDLATDELRRRASQEPAVDWNNHAWKPVVSGFEVQIDDLALGDSGKDFYGIFSANNSPDLARFPNGVTYQRHADFTTRRLLDTDGTTPVAVSIAPDQVRIAAKIDGMIIEPPISTF